MHAENSCGDPIRPWETGVQLFHPHTTCSNSTARLTVYDHLKALSDATALQFSLAYLRCIQRQTASPQLPSVQEQALPFPIYPAMSDHQTVFITVNKSLDFLEVNSYGSCSVNLGMLYPYSVQARRGNITQANRRQLCAASNRREGRRRLHVCVHRAEKQLRGASSESRRGKQRARQKGMGSGNRTNTVRHLGRNQRA